MGTRAGESVTRDFTVRTWETQVLTDADALPTGVLVRNGVDTSVPVTITNKTTGRYTFSVTIPPSYEAGDEVQVYITAIVDGDTDSEIVWSETLDGDVATTSITSTFDPTSVVYGSITEGNAYFATRLHSEKWDSATETNKLKAIATATRLIDRLNFVGEKADEDQELEFPRGTDTVVPQAIKIAAYEIAIILLDGYDIEFEQELLRQGHSTFGQLSTSNDLNVTPEHKLHNIPSILAWSYLLPYLRDPRVVTISRVS